MGERVHANFCGWGNVFFFLIRGDPCGDINFGGTGNGIFEG